MNELFIKKFLPHLVALVILAVASMIYFAPAVFEGKTLNQNDALQGQMAAKEITKFTEQEKREILWSNAMFSGMPTYQGMTGYNYNIVGKTVLKAGTLFTTDDGKGGYFTTAGVLFLLALGMYILLAVIGIDWRISLLGSFLFAVSTSNILLIEAGHIAKVLAIANIPPIMAGVLLCMKSKYFQGAALIAIFTALMIQSQHIQITFYFFLSLLILVIIKLVQAIREGNVSGYVKAVGAMAIGAVIGVLTNITTLWTQQDFTPQTIRGKSELVSAEGTQRNGLDKEYAYSWSMGVMESFSVLVPDIYGATSRDAFVQDPESASLKALRAMNSPQANELAQLTSKYWGDQPFTSGAPYWGAALFFLFVLGMFLLKDNLKWWGLGSIILLMMLGWGKNFSAFNFFLFDNVPLFNKFRAVTMTFNLIPFILVLIGMFAMSRLFSTKVELETKQKALMNTLYVTLGISVLVLLYGFMSDLSGPNDGQLSQFPNLLSAIKEDRGAALRGDAFRALIMTLLTFGILYSYLKFRLSGVVALVVLSVISLFDIVGINKRYLSNDMFILPNKAKQMFGASPADNQIMSDNSYYRVLDLGKGSNPFSNAHTSAFHKSVGGYYAAKLMIYQELIEAHLSKVDGKVLGYLAGAGDSTGVSMGTANALSMLNTKYIIYPGEKENAVLENKKVQGAAWFVKDIVSVKNANEELDKLASIDTRQQALVQENHSNPIKGFSPQYDSSATIEMTKYIPDHITYKTKAKSDQFAVFSEVYYPEERGMHVYIDGKLQENQLVKTNYVLRGAKIPAGEHTVEFKFEPKAYYTGVNLARIGSLLTLLLVIGAIWQVWRNKELLKDATKIFWSAPKVETAMPQQAPPSKRK